MSLLTREERAELKQSLARSIEAGEVDKAIAIANAKEFRLMLAQDANDAALREIEKYGEPRAALVALINDHMHYHQVLSFLRTHTARNKRLEARIAALEARPQLAYRGIWDPRETYQKSEIVTDHGSMFFCRCETKERPGVSSDWQLCVKRGADGKDAQR